MKFVSFDPFIVEPKPTNKCFNCKFRFVKPYYSNFVVCDRCMKDICENCIIIFINELQDTKHILCVNCYLLYFTEKNNIPLF